MNFLDAAFLDNVAQLQLAGFSFGTNHDIYDKRLTMPNPWPPFNYVPHYIYFYHVRVSEKGNLLVDHYEYGDGPDPDHPNRLAEIPYNVVPRIVQRLTEDARRGNVRTPTGRDFRSIIWKRRSYIAIVLDEPNWTFHKRDPDRSSIVFNLAKGSCPNQSFFDAQDLDVPAINPANGQVQGCSGVYFVNHMTRDSAGTPVDRPGQQFYFDMYVDAKYARSAEKMTIILDPGGSNEGPPEQPTPIG